MGNVIRPILAGIEGERNRLVAAVGSLGLPGTRAEMAQDRRGTKNSIFQVELVRSGCSTVIMTSILYAFYTWSVKRETSQCWRSSLHKPQVGEVTLYPFPYYRSFWKFRHRTCQAWWYRALEKSHIWRKKVYSHFSVRMSMLQPHYQHKARQKSFSHLHHLMPLVARCTLSLIESKLKTKKEVMWL